ncbi:MAG: precorrin-8X methylmutase [Desulfobacteraceae bacterium]|nr:precorrin-8X methylmutase [Desulfobacteraceae bacterium]
MKPEEIESLSFAIIDKEAGPHEFTPVQWPIVRRMIHTTADFEYLRDVRFHPLAVTAGLEAIRQGRAIITDTHMARQGARKKELEKFGVSVTCLIADPDVTRQAAAKGTTRAKAAVDAGSQIMQGGIYVVGNAPTALLRLLELVDSGQADPALIIGLPVGFVNAVESKAGLLNSQVPYITNIGRKGGSTVAISAVNALALMAVDGER